MTDRVQVALQAMCEGHAGPSVSDALDELAREWRPRVRRFLQSPSPDEVEEWLADAMLALVVEPYKDGTRRALAPDGADSPKAWRRKVLQRFLIDRARYRGRRRHVEQAARDGLSPEDEKAQWQADKERRMARRRAPEAAVVEVAAPVEVVDASDPRGMERRAVWAVLPQLPVLRAVILVLALRGDPSPLAERLAAELDEAVEAVLHRVAVALAAPPDHVHDLLTMAMVRVGWPEGPERKALDAARKALSRAQSQVRKLLQTGSEG